MTTFPLSPHRARIVVGLLTSVLLATSLASCNSATTEKAGTEASSTESAAGETASQTLEPETADEQADASVKSAGDDAQSSPPAESIANAEDAKKDVPPGTDPLLQGAPRRTTEGWWRMVLSVGGGEDYPNDYSAGFIKIGKTGDGKYQVEEVRTNDIVNPAKAVRSEATDKTVRIFFEHEENKFDYAGTLDEGIIRGTLQFSNPRQNLVRLTPVTPQVAASDKELERRQLGTTFGSEEIVETLQSDDRVEQLNEIAKTWRKSPVLFTAYDLLLQNSTQFELDRPTIERLANDFEAAAQVWGDRAVQAARLNTAVDLLLSATETDLAEEKLALARKDAPELVESWEELLGIVRERGLAEKAKRERVAAVENAVEQIKSGEVGPGIATLRQLHAEKPADPVATYRLAKAIQEHGSKDEALDLFARLAVLPQTELELGEVAAEGDYAPPRVVAARLYEEVNGNRDGFSDFLKTVYRDSITSFLTIEDRNRQPTGSGRASLVELFTGSTCPPCVAADVATEAVEASFPSSDAVVLRYHVHIPGPDPLANSDSLARMDYYGAEVGGTPTVLIDGEKVPYNIGGAYSGSPEIYAELANSLVEVAAKPPQGSIELTANLNGENLGITANASAPEKPADSVRLRIAIAESHIDYAARNGIKQHEMVVREMPGGAAGIAAVDGTFSFEQEIPLIELRDRLNSYLTSAEGPLRTSFGDRPLDLRKLTVVAFLQDDTTREILQTTIVPIEQDVELPPLEEAEATTEAEAAEASSERPPGPALTPQE
ncbi:MAG: thioredoxin family protein [Planctomycetota bacterium]|nr:hypothetical protein [Planctomycetaceae bacterium]MDQ3331507.1 thioredoxin family protein [Planctomycetota bacterium]